MTAGLQFDDEATRRTLAMYVTPDVTERRGFLLDALALRPGEAVLNLGCGPGFQAAEMADVIGSAGRVCGIDISEPMLALARNHCAARSWIDLRFGDATQVPYPDAEFDAADALQVLEYVRDVPAALAEAFRTLRPGGRFAVLDVDWDSIVWNAPDRALHERVLAAWNAHCADPYLPRSLARLLTHAGFEIQHRSVFVLFNPEYDPQTYSARLIDLIVGYVTGQERISRTDASDWADGVRRAGAVGEYFFSLNHYLYLATKPTHPAP